jgi:hypothetical protein
VAHDEESPSSSTGGQAGSDGDEKPQPAAPDDLAAIASALLERRSACAGSRDCLEDVQEDPAEGFPPGVIDLPSTDRAVSLLDDFGGAAVMRVDPRRTGGDASAQLVVIVAAGGGWLLRDVHDVDEGG